MKQSAIQAEPTPPGPVSEETIVEKAIYAFFSHRSGYQSGDLKNSKTRDKYLKELIEVSREIFNLIHSGEYIKKHDWIEDAVKDKIIPKKFTTIKNQLSKGTIRYKDKRARNFRGTFNAICITFLDIINCDPSKLSDGYLTIREKVGITEINTLSKDQRKTIENIRKELRRFSENTYPKWPITFNSEERVSIKIDSHRDFAKSTEVQEYVRYVKGRYLAFRRAFTPQCAEKIFIKEHIILQDRKEGVTFRWKTRRDNGNIIREIKGVGFFTSGALWLIGQDSDPLQRIRFFSASVAEWKNHTENLEDYPYCTGVVLSMDQGDLRHCPMSRLVLLKKEIKSPKSDYTKFTMPEFLTHDEITKYLTQNEVDCL